MHLHTLKIKQEHSLYHSFEFQTSYLRVIRDGWENWKQWSCQLRFRVEIFLSNFFLWTIRFVQFEYLQCQEHSIWEHLFFYMYVFIRHENYSKIGMIFCIHLTIIPIHLRVRRNIKNNKLINRYFSSYNRWYWNQSLSYNIMLLQNVHSSIILCIDLYTITYDVYLQCVWLFLVVSWHWIFICHNFFCKM